MNLTAACMIGAKSTPIDERTDPWITQRWIIREDRGGGGGGGGNRDSGGGVGGGGDTRCLVRFSKPRLWQPHRRYPERLRELE